MFGLLPIVLVSLASSVAALPLSESSTQDVQIRDLFSTNTVEVSSLEQRSSDDDSSQHTLNQCHGATEKGYIHFIDPIQPNVTLFIGTNWYILYTKQLKPKIESAGFRLTIPSGTAKCGWNTVDKVTKTAVDRGNIGYRQTANLNAVEDYSPSEETVARIRDVLLSTYPSLEIAMIVAFTVILPMSLFLCICMAESCSQRRRMRK